MRLGSDPEVFLQDSAGKPISSIGFIQADKWNPLQIPDMEKGFTLQEDNVSLEYGIPPAATAEEFVHHIQAVMERSKEWVPGLSFSKLSCIVFPEDQMQHPLAHVFGCEPDWCAWTGSTNPKPVPPHPFLRSAGGHIHVETTEDKHQVVKGMDLFLGVPSVLMDEEDLTPKLAFSRRVLYGRAGALRYKDYGVEYRTLSNFWIFKEELIKWVWRNTARALENVSMDYEPYAEQIQQCINSSDKKLAKKLIKHFQLEVV
jgi:hypothetical protein